MKLKKELFVNFALSVFVASVLIFFFQKGLLKRLELSAFDFSLRLKSNFSPQPKIIIIEITDTDIIKVGRWPWKRAWLAACGQALSRLGAKFVYFDIMLSEASSDDDDVLFEEALKLNKNIYLPFAFYNIDGQYERMLIPLGRFLPYVKGFGANNIYPDIDGIMRSIPLVFNGKDKTRYHIALKIAMDYEGLNINRITSRYIFVSGSKGAFNIPLIKNNMLIDWPGKWREAFKHYSFLEILAAYQDSLDNKKPQINLEEFKDSICLIGITAIGLYDIKPTPMEPEYPGIAITASAISDILNRRFFYSPPFWVSILIFYILSLLPAFLIFGKKPFKEAVFAFLISGGYFAANQFLFRKGVKLDLAFPLLGFFSSYFIVEFYNFIRIFMERQAFFKMAITDGLTGLYNIRYFKAVLESEIMLTKANPVGKFCVILSDVDNFKHFNDTYGHQAGDLILKKTADVMRNTLRSSDIIARYGGEEIIIFLRSASLKDGLALAEKLRKNVENNYIKNQESIYNIKISSGVAVFKPQDSLDTLIKRSDEGLYRAKGLGKNRVFSVEVENEK